MAISKQQPMRSAEVDAIDAINSLQVSLSETASDVTAEETARANADNLLSGRINEEETARANADNEIMGIIGDSFTEADTISDEISAIWQAIESITGGE